MVSSNAALGGLVLLGIGAALGLLGLVLIWYSGRMTREAIARRVDLVRNKSNAATLRAGATPTDFDRHGANGAAEPEIRATARLFAALGVPPSLATTALLISRGLAMILLGIGVYFALGRYAVFTVSPARHLLLSGGLGTIGWFVPGFVVGRIVKRRAKAIVDGLPDALELLVICVEAGLSFEDGIDRIVGELKRSQPDLADELALTSADLKILPTRERALANLAERVPAPSVRSVVTTLSQTMRYGTPLAHALRGVASELRNDALVKLEERANQLPTLMTIPMMIFIMPTIFLIVGGPAVLKLLDAFQH